MSLLFRGYRLIERCTACSMTSILSPKTIVRIPRLFGEEVDVVEVGRKQDLDGVGLLADAAIENVEDSDVVVDDDDVVDDASSSVLSSSLLLSSA